MTDATESTCLPVAVWFLYSVEGEAMGSVYRRDAEAVPEVGLRLTAGDGTTLVEVVEYGELRATCAMRRFRVAVRTVEPGTERGD